MYLEYSLFPHFSPPTKVGETEHTFFVFLPFKLAQLAFLRLPAAKTGHFRHSYLLILNFHHVASKSGHGEIIYAELPCSGDMEVFRIVHSCMLLACRNVDITLVYPQIG